MRARDGFLPAGKKRRSSKTAKSNDNRDEDVFVNNNNNNNVNVNDDRLSEDGESLQNGHCGVKTENDEEADAVSELPVSRGLRKLSRTKTSGNDTKQWHLVTVV